MSLKKTQVIEQTDETEKGGKAKKRFKLEVPHTFVILGMIILFAVILTHLVPAGEFDRVLDPVTDREIVVQGSYHSVESNPIGLFDMFIYIQKGMVDSADIIFFIIFAYAMVFMLLKSGSLDAAVGALLRKIGDKVELLIPVFMIFFGILGATAGLFEEIYGLIPAFLGIAIALGYDAIVGGAIVIVGIGTGFAAAFTNPFTIGVAQGVAGVPMFSGIGFRVLAFIAFQAAVIAYTMNYARKIKKNPELSIVKDVKFSLTDNLSIHELKALKFENRHKISMLAFGLSILLIVVGTLKLGWYIDELAGLFLVLMIVIGFINKKGLNEISEIFVEAAASIAFGALAVGLSRSVLLVMSDGMIIDTMVNSLAGLLVESSAYVSALGMLFLQNLINFIIPSGSGQAATSMPIMAPVADIVGLTRQTAVLAFQFGDGFSNLFWPTIVSVECGLMGIPLNKWYKFMGPLFVIMLVIQVIFMSVAVMINYGPI
ncbi:MULTISPECIES: YfcC family protein [unclassified Fusibacter]|uniref:YfcC family protein n=1 Tax=unclassified Fusibacter TaxID=2624464 RepID=UPI0010123347|nr:MULTISPECIES: TIGR00366 family protein [unclassified Fusibacter]MCK8060100.1 TIGR00366 family protein [Fusibacter sp. A2]NPE22242.1 YfcC family protein [Fusibacter sp. A1]RXV61016.1 YfcC family protein [Fusibacter sp. A1]